MKALPLPSSTERRHPLVPARCSLATDSISAIRGRKRSASVDREPDRSGADVPDIPPLHPQCPASARDLGQIGLEIASSVGTSGTFGKNPPGSNPPAPPDRTLARLRPPPPLAG